MWSDTGRRIYLSANMLLCSNVIQGSMRGDRKTLNPLYLLIHSLSLL